MEFRKRRGSLGDCLKTTFLQLYLYNLERTYFQKKQSLKRVMTIPRNAQNSNLAQHVTIGQLWYLRKIWTFDKKEIKWQTIYQNSTLNFTIFGCNYITKKILPSLCEIFQGDFPILAASIANFSRKNKWSKCSTGQVDFSFETVSKCFHLWTEEKTKIFEIVRKVLSFWFFIQYFPKCVQSQNLILLKVQIHFSW